MGWGPEVAGTQLFISRATHLQDTSEELTVSLTSMSEHHYQRANFLFKNKKNLPEMEI